MGAVKSSSKEQWKVVCVLKSFMSALFCFCLSQYILDCPLYAKSTKARHPFRAKYGASYVLHWEGEGQEEGAEIE